MMSWFIRKQDLIRGVLSVLILGCILVILLMYGRLNTSGFALFCNADVYADTQVAMRMWEQKTLFPDGWLFGNQFYVAATPVLAALLYGLTGSINTAMILATEIMTLLILLSFWWLLRGLTRDVLLQLTACLVLLLSNVAPYGPYSVNSMLFYTQASFYACYLITMFVVFGDYIRVYKEEMSNCWMWILGLVLSFAMGMQSLRQTVVMVLPILCCELFLTARRALLGKKAWNMLTLIRSVSYALANGAGVVAIKLLSPPNTSIYGQLEAASLETLGQRLAPLYTAICEITSLDYVLNGECSRNLMLLIVGLVLIVAAAALMWLLRIHKEETGLELCWLLLAVGFLGVLLSTVVLNITLRGIYLFMWFPLVACSVVLLAEKTPAVLRVGVILLVCGAGLVGMRESYGLYLQIAEKNTQTDAAQVCQWAMERDYAYVYGAYWDGASLVAVYSDGALKAGCWHEPEDTYKVLDLNTHQDIYSEEDNRKAIYVFTPADEQIGLERAKERNVEMTLEAQFGDYRVYTASQQLMIPKKP